MEDVQIWWVVVVMINAVIMLQDPMMFFIMFVYSLLIHAMYNLLAFTHRHGPILGGYSMTIWCGSGIYTFVI